MGTSLVALNELIIELMNSEDYFINVQMFKFVHLPVLISEANCYQSSLVRYDSLSVLFLCFLF